MKTVRDGKKVWPYCPECGCRLFYHKLWRAEYLAHKLSTKDVDKAGHKCSMIGSWWDVTPEIKTFIGV